MNKNQLIWGGVGLVVILAVVFNLSRSSEAPTPQVAEDGSINGKYSIEGILGLGRAYECSFAKADNTSEVNGTIFTDGKQVYGEFNIDTQIINQSFQSFLVIKENTTYSWTSLQPVGYKAPVVKSASVNTSPQNQAQLVGTADLVDYSCKPWTNIDAKKFELPTNVTFVDLKQD